MWQYNYTSDYICHWGVKGQKWGVRRYQNPDGTLTPAGKQRYKEYKSDNKTRRVLSRHVAADKHNLRDKGRAMNDARVKYDEAGREYRKASSAVFISRKKRDEWLKEASDNLSKVGENLEKRESDLERAKRLYNKDAEALKKHVDNMAKKYGSENVKGIDTNTIKLGKYYTMEVIKTGASLADMPFVGRWYSGYYTSGEEYNDRKETIKRKSQDRY